MANVMVPARITVAEAELFRTIRLQGADSAQISDEQLERAITILCRELDGSLIPQENQADAKLACAFLSSALARRQAIQANEELRVAAAAAAETTRQHRWWEIF